MPSMPNVMARRLFELVEPVAVVTYRSAEATDAVIELGAGNVWDRVTPEAVSAAREQGSVAALRRILGDLAASPGVARAGDLMIKAGTSARAEGRPLYAAVRTLPVPTEPIARLWHGANLLREHRGDGHVAALVTVGIGGTEAHVLHALSEGMQAEQFGRVAHLPRAQLAAAVDAMRARNLIGTDGWLTAAGRQVKLKPPPDC